MQRPLTAHDLLRYGPLARLGRELFVFDEADSTNAFLKRRVSNAPDGSVAVAEFQTAGRGRQGRPWLAPRGSSILLSVLLIEPPDSPLIPRAAMLASLAACEAIERGTDCEPRVRWPNDIVLAGKKLGGVLVETVPHGPQRGIIVGVGINCLQQRGHFSTELARTATSLEIESAQPVERAVVAGHLIQRLDAHFSVAKPDAEHWDRLAIAWKSRCDDAGRRATLNHDGRTFVGTVLDVTDSGDLILELEGGGRRRFDAATTTRIW